MISRIEKSLYTEWAFYQLEYNALLALLCFKFGIINIPYIVYSDKAKWKQRVKK